MTRPLKGEAMEVDIRSSAAGANVDIGAKADSAASTDTGTFSLIALTKRLLQKFTTQFPAALGGTTAANSFPVTLSTDGPFVQQTGSVTETAPASDTASSGLNGRLQRIAQRLTSLLVQGAATLANSLSVNDASATLYAGTLTTSTSAAALASTQAVREVMVQNDPDNTIDVLVGNASAQTIQLKPGWSVMIPASDIATVYVKSISGTPVVNYLGRS